MSKHVLNTRLDGAAWGIAHAPSSSSGDKRRSPSRRLTSNRTVNCGVATLNRSLPQESLVEEGDLPSPIDVVAEADWRARIERLYRERAANLIHHFAGETRDRDGARDIVHEAFSRLADLGFARRLTITRPDSYLFRICLNLFHDRGRVEMTHRTLEADAEAESAAAFHNPIAQLESRDTLRRLEKAMLRLNPKTRAIFLARRLDGLSYAEIAERTGLSVKGVEKQMAKAIATIDRLMERQRS
jgi:RNA polymerase sigma-70 factor (ECF subfamily)